MNEKHGRTDERGARGLQHIQTKRKPSALTFVAVAKQREYGRNKWRAGIRKVPGARKNYHKRHTHTANNEIRMINGRKLFVTVKWKAARGYSEKSHWL